MTNYSDMSKGDLISLLKKRNAPDVQGEKPRRYPIGPLTHEKVFEAAGLTNLSDMQAVLDAVEAALSAPAAPDVQEAPTRDDLIQCFLATRGLSDGVTADAILSMLTAAPAAPVVQGEPVGAEQQPYVTQLVDALETTAEKLKLVMETAQYIQHTIDKALAPAREALAAYRNQGGES